MQGPIDEPRPPRERKPDHTTVQTRGGLHGAATRAHRLAWRRIDKGRRTGRRWVEQGRIHRMRVKTEGAQPLPHLDASFFGAASLIAVIRIPGDTGFVLILPRRRRYETQLLFRMLRSSFSQRLGHVSGLYWIANLQNNTLPPPCWVPTIRWKAVVAGVLRSSLIDAEVLEREIGWHEMGRHRRMGAESGRLISTCSHGSMWWLPGRSFCRLGEEEGKFFCPLAFSEKKKK
ncbi:hypothetical protein B0H13DRAFT_1902763 [Mycena leptocephala]|nr:hypothetical protein B0H13DRAFT_1902763 [Mycena leptocephala]